MNNQEIFNRVLSHIRLQKVQAVGSREQCVYRGPEGTKCAVGCLIPDDVYNADMEGSVIREVMYNSMYVPALKDSLDAIGIHQDQYPLLAQLQDAHDGENQVVDWNLPNWEDEMREIANAFNLEYKEPVHG